LFTLVGIAGEDDLDAPDLIGASKAAPERDRRPRSHGNGRLDAKSASIAARTPVARPKKRAVDNGAKQKAHVLAAVRLDIALSASLRDAMLGELNQVGSEYAATQWAHRRLTEKNKLNTPDAKHIEEAFRAKLLSFAIHHGKGAAPSKNGKQSSDAIDAHKKKARAPIYSVDKSALTHPEPRRVRDRDHVRFVAQQSCLVCGRQPCDAHHLRFAQNRALGRRVSDEFTVPLCRGHHREVHRHGDEGAWWEKVGLDPTGAARSLWCETHPLRANQLADVAADLGRSDRS
jgi:hypothetical protein